MSISIVSYQDLKEDLRFDGEYYRLEYLEVEELLEKNRYYTQLFNVAKKSKKRFNPLREPQSEFYYIEIDDINLSDGRFTYKKVLNSQAPSRARKLLEYQDVFISTVRPNRNAISIFLRQDNNFVCSTGFAVIKPQKIIPIFLFLFLKTRFAINQLVRRTSAAMYPAVSENDIMNLKLINPPQSFQLHIKQMVQSAYEKQKYADQKYRKAEELLLTQLGVEDFKVSLAKTNIITYSDYKKSLRLDSRYYLPKYEDALEMITNSGFEILTVSDIVLEPIKSGATPLAGTNAYIGKKYGIPFFRIVNIKDYQLVLEDLLYIRPDIHITTLKRSQIKLGDVLFSIAGTIGICTIVPETIKEGNINQALAILRLKSDFNPYFVSIYFNSIIGRLISEKISRPVVQSNLNLTELGTLKIPKFPRTAQNKIASLVQDSFKLRKEGEDLIKTAIKKVEDFIEGKSD